MKTNTATLLCGTLLTVLSLPINAWSDTEDQIWIERYAQNTAPAASGPKAITTKLSEVPTYRPPLRGAPGGRVSAGTRGEGEYLVTLSPLAPDHAGLTLKDQPSLYWYLSNVVSASMVFTLIDEKAIHPLAEIELGAPSESGVQRLSLADHGITLMPDIDYEWSVAIVADPSQRSKDVMARGMIRRIAPSATLVKRIESTDEQGLTQIYAEEGLWYDAIEAISKLVAENPNDEGFRLQRAALLEQVDLPEAAAQDKRMVANK